MSIETIAVELKTETLSDPLMAKKKAAKKTSSRSGGFYGIRCTDEDVEILEMAANAEGFSTVTQWMLVNARKRARAIVAASEAGDSINISEVIVTPEQK